MNMMIMMMMMMMIEVTSTGLEFKQETQIHEELQVNQT
jgi:hypothetical protein